MPISQQLKNLHLLWRAGFGPDTASLNQLSSISTEELYGQLNKAAQKEPEYLNAASSDLTDLYTQIQKAPSAKNKGQLQRRTLNKQLQAAIKNLNLKWLNEMAQTQKPFREKMAFFWHCHFACRNNNVFYNQLLLHVFRTHALGDFRTLLKQVSRSASMLFFLNNQQNKKGHANENFAREVMELFTLGRGNYTENDVKEAARAFTGWTANRDGTFVFRPKIHDELGKKILGKRGNFDGDDVLDIILANKKTSLFITKKIYRFFVNDIIDDAIVNELAQSFYADNYDIGKLMRTIFTSNWFYNEKNIGSRIKSPVELITGIRRLLPIKLKNEQPLFSLQKILGQQLLRPPNVAGWAGGKSWIDSSTLMMRLRIPQMFVDKDVLNVAPKQDDDVMMGLTTDGVVAVPTTNDAKKLYGNFHATIEWPKYLHNYETVKKEELLPAIQSYLFQTKNTNVKSVVQNEINKSSREEFIKSATIKFMSTPEYQLC